MLKELGLNGVDAQEMNTLEMMQLNGGGGWLESRWLAVRDGANDMA